MTITDDKRKIVWIVSYPKSGNTWIRVFLENLYSASDQPAEINKLSMAKIASSRMLFDNFSGVNSSDLTHEEIDTSRPHIYRQMAMEADSEIFLKVHDGWRLNCREEELFPSDVTKGVIYILRNPLDVAVSNAYHNSITHQESVHRMNHGQVLCHREEKLYSQFRQDLFSWSRHVLSWVDDSKLPVHVIRYEDLVKNPDHFFSLMVSYLGLKFGPEEIAGAVKNSELGILKQQESLEGFREKPIQAEQFFRIGSFGSGKKELPGDLVDSIHRNHRAVSERFGYVHSITDLL